MAGRPTNPPLGRPTKQSVPASRVKKDRKRKAGEATTAVKKAAAGNKKFQAVAAAAGFAAAARKKSPRKPAKRRVMPERDLDTAIKSGREIKGEVPEALAYFLEVYGRLGRG
jgi:hypothetical protein